MIFNHLQDVNQTYFEHFRDTLCYSYLSLRACIFFLIHGIYPDIFIKSGSTTIHNINEKIIKKYKKDI